jgi:hypothetical protein
MEEINFLVSSGRCFVIFGMAVHRVQAALALAFKDIARELVELDVHLQADASAEDKERAERDRRHTYARDYLEKLINLEITVPNRTDIAPHLLLEASAEDLTSRTTVALQTTMQLWPLWLGACAIALGAVFGSHFHLTDAPPAVMIQPAGVIESAVSSPPSPTTPSPTQPDKGAQAKPSVATQRYIPAVQPGDDRQIAWGYFAITLTVFAGCAVGFVVFRLRKSLRQVSDSTAFVQALRIWTPVVQQWRSTPRAIKRFGSRVRYLAMLQQSEGFDESGFDEFRRRLPAWLQRIYIPLSTPTISTTTSGLEIGSARHNDFQWREVAP